jgi:hypothetical protein
MIEFAEWLFGAYVNVCMYGIGCLAVIVIAIVVIGIPLLILL